MTFDIFPAGASLNDVPIVAYSVSFRAKQEAAVQSGPFS
jgi:hypothetical protein